MHLYQKLADCVRKDVVAIRATTHLQPVAGPGTKVFPPTYEGGKYAFEKRWSKGQPVDVVLLDAVQSQANRIEAALLSACLDGRVSLPAFRMVMPGHSIITSLDAPHRVHDAIFRDALWDGTLFRRSPEGQRIIQARATNATAFFQYAPNVLLFGGWDSQGGAGMNTAKVPRAIVSEIVGIEAIRGVTTSSRVDPLGIQAVEKIIYKSADPNELWTLDESKAQKEKGKPVLMGKKGKPSEINHGNVMPSITPDNGPGGVTFNEAVQTTVISITQLRRLRFPEGNSERDAAGRTVLAALGLYSILLTWDEGFDLRSRCQLIPTAAPQFEILKRSADDVEPLPADTASARGALEEALEYAKSFGLEWRAGFIDLKPTEKLLKLIEISDSLSVVEDAVGASASN